MRLSCFFYWTRLYWAFLSLAIALLVPIEGQAQSLLLQSKELTESSGLAVSTRNKEIIWTHNDSGDKPRLFAFDLNTGRLLAVANLPDAKARDWEDMCAFEDRGRHFLAVGDVGDNLARRESVSIYVFEEPELLGRAVNGKPKGPIDNTRKIEIRRVLEMRFRYQSGPCKL